MSEKQEKIKKQSRVRLWFQLAWFVLTNGYVRGYTNGVIFTGRTKVLCLPGLNCYSCPGALGACPMGALQAVLGNTSYRISLYVFGLIAAMGVAFGRLICGWMCPFGLFQDLMYRIRFKIKKKNLPGHRYLKYLRYVILVVFPVLLVIIMTDVTGTGNPWFCEWICPSGMLLGAIPLVATNASFKAAIGARFIWKLCLLIAITLLSIIYYRPFCKYLCPLGAIYGFFNPISTYRLEIDKDKCVACGSCQRACGMDIKTFETPNSLECIRCGSCVAACPTGAIESTWHKTGQKIRSRCFIDDGDLLPAGTEGKENNIASSDAEAASAKSGIKKPVFLGALMIIGGASSIFAAIKYIVASSLESHYTIDVYQDANIGVALGGTLWCVASVIVLLSGVYAMRFSEMEERLMSIGEKLKIARKTALFGLLVIFAGIIFSPQTLMDGIVALLYDFYVLIGIPLMMLQVRLMNREMEGKKIAQPVWWIMSVINTLLAFASPWLVMLATAGE